MYVLHQSETSILIFENCPSVPSVDQCLCVGEVTSREKGGIVTRNQIAYFEASEKQRSNLAQEQIKRAELAEQQRHSLVTESQGAIQLQEQRRHNVVGEQVEWGKLREQTTHNRAQEQTALFDAQTKRYSAETAVSQAAKELAERIRSNKANEAISWANNAVAQSQVGATIYASNNAFNSAAGNQKIESLKLAETTRHNKATEETQLRTSTAGIVKTAGDWALTLLGWKVKGGSK